MQRYVTADEVRAAEAPLLAAQPEGTLMRRAAHAVAAAALRMLRADGVYGSRVALAVGSGDNGGDALYAGAELARRGAAVTAFVLGERYHGAGAEALRRSGGRALPADALGSTETSSGPWDLVIDGILGISGRGALRPDAAALIDGFASAPILSVDIPSGVDADTGHVAGAAVRATRTVTFSAPRRAHVLAAPWCGRIEVADIGIDGIVGVGGLAALSPAEIGAAWPVPGPADSKYTQGVLGVVAGSPSYPGAAVLCTAGALAATSGMVRFVGKDPAVIAAHPELVTSESVEATGRVQAWVVGPGLGLDDDAHRRLAEVLGRPEPVLVDADALTLLSREPTLLAGRTAPTLLTPHDGEFARLAGHPVGEDRPAEVAALAERLGVVVLLKGSTTVISGDPVLASAAGNAWAATAGSGDVLSGVIGALLAAGVEPNSAAAMGARAHALAADVAARGRDAGPGAPITAGSLAAALPEAIRLLRTEAVRGAGPYAVSMDADAVAGSVQ